MFTTVKLVLWIKNCIILIKMNGIFEIVTRQRNFKMLTCTMRMNPRKLVNACDIL